MKYSAWLSTLDDELFPGLHEVNDTRRWRRQKWLFAIMLGLALAYGARVIWRSEEPQVEKHAEHASAQAAAQRHSLKRTSQTSWLEELQSRISHVVSASMAIPKGTSIPVEIDSAESLSPGRIRILARTTSYVFPGKTAMIPPGSEVQGIAQQVGKKWEISWSSVAVISVSDRWARITARNEVPEKESLGGRSLLVKAK